VLFGPDEPKEKGNWIKTVPGKGWFPIFRFYGPQAAFFVQNGTPLIDVRSIPLRFSRFGIYGR